MCSNTPLLRFKFIGDLFQIPWTLRMPQEKWKIWQRVPSCPSRNVFGRYKCPLIHQETPLEVLKHRRSTFDGQVERTLVCRLSSLPLAPPQDTIYLHDDGQN